MKESDLFLPVKNKLLEIGCTNVYGEVLSVDVLGIHGPVNIIVEMKTNLTFKLLDQVRDRRDLGQYLYIAIPKRKTRIPYVAKEILKQMKVGLMVIEKDQWSDELHAKIDIPARYHRYPPHRNSQYIRNHIQSFHDNQIGGKQSGNDVMTVYKTTIESVKDFLTWNRRGKWVSMDEILDYCETHYANPKPSLSKALREFEHDWCETTKIKNRVHFRSNLERSAVSRF